MPRRPSGCRYGLTVMVIRGDPTPTMTATLTPPATPPLVGEYFEVKLNVMTSEYVASGVQVQPTLMPSGMNYASVQRKLFDHAWTTHDPITPQDALTLGNLLPNWPRQASYWFRANTPGLKTFFVRAWSENRGRGRRQHVVPGPAPTPLTADLVQTGMGTSPATPIAAPGGTFSVTDTVQNVGPVEAEDSKTRYYLSLDAVKGAGDILLTGSHSVPDLAAGASHTATVKVTVPAGTALGSYFVLSCADDSGGVDESDEGNNCTATPGATVTVTRPDLVVNTVSAPPATARRGGKFAVTSTAQNPGAVASGSSTTRYHLSLDGVKGAGDKLLTGSRKVSALAPGASQSGTVTVTVPTSTGLGTYFLLACADDLSKVVETNETNNCTVSTNPVTITP